MIQTDRFVCRLVRRLVRRFACFACFDLRRVFLPLFPPEGICGTALLLFFASAFASSAMGAGGGGGGGARARALTSAGGAGNALAAVVAASVTAGASLVAAVALVTAGAGAGVVSSEDANKLLKSMDLVNVSETLPNPLFIFSSMLETVSFTLDKMDFGASESSPAPRPLVESVSALTEFVDSSSDAAPRPAAPRPPAS